MLVNYNCEAGFRLEARFCLTVLVLATSLLLGCVTQSSGGMPGPAPDAERLSAQLDLARGYLEQRDWARAKPPLTRALAIDNANVGAHVLSAVMFHAENEPELAEKHYQLALKYDPSNSQALNNYASFLYAQARYTQALVPLEKLIDDTNYRARAQVFESLGLTYRQVGEIKKAEAAFKRALQLDVRLPRSNLELAEMSFDAGRLASAQMQFDFYNRLAKASAKSLCLGLKIAAASKDADELARYRMSLKNLYPDAATQCQT